MAYPELIAGEGSVGRIETQEVGQAASHKSSDALVLAEEKAGRNEVLASFFQRVNLYGFLVEATEFAMERLESAQLLRRRTAHEVLAKVQPVGVGVFCVRMLGRGRRLSLLARRHERVK
jgi:hypothetical protein